MGPAIEMQRTLGLVVVLVILLIVLAPGQLEFLKRSHDQSPSGGKLQRAGFDVRLRIDDHLLSAMPLDQQHAMADLASGYAIDGEVAEKSGGAKIGKGLADFCRIEAVRVFDRGFGQQSRRIRLRRRIVARDIWRIARAYCE